MKAEKYKETIENIEKAREEAVLGHKEGVTLEKAERILKVLKLTAEGKFEESEKLEEKYEQNPVI